MSRREASESVKLVALLKEIANDRSELVSLVSEFKQLLQRQASHELVAKTLDAAIAPNAIKRMWARIPSERTTAFLALVVACGALVLELTKDLPGTGPKYHLDAYEIEQPSVGESFVGRSIEIVAVKRRKWGHLWAVNIDDPYSTYRYAKRLIIYPANRPRIRAGWGTVDLNGSDRPSRSWYLFLAKEAPSRPRAADDPERNRPYEPYGYLRLLLRQGPFQYTCLPEGEQFQAL